MSDRASKTMPCVICGAGFRPRGRADTCSKVCSRSLARIRHREWYARNGDHRRKVQREYYAANSDRLLKQAKRYRKANAKLIKSQRQQCYAANRERNLERLRQYQDRNRDCLNKKARTYQRKVRAVYAACKELNII